LILRSMDEPNILEAIVPRESIKINPQNHRLG
jgi:hypothetical protein